MRLINADALKEDYLWCKSESTPWDYTWDAAMERVDMQPTIQPESAKWISVDDRLPDTDDHVLCCTQTKAGRQNVVIGYYMDGMWRCGMNSNVTYWMPLPEPPEGVDTHG